MNYFRKALVVDDDPTSRFLLKLQLKKFIQMSRVVDLADGQQALNYLIDHCRDEHAASEDCPDLVLLDLNMPVMDGLEFLSHLHRMQQTNPIYVKVLVITSSSHPKDIEQAFKFNISGYLLKPVTAESLSTYFAQ